MKKPILHITHDDKFIDFMIDTWNEISDFENVYIVYTKGEAKSLKHVKHPSVKHAPIFSKELDSLIGSTSNYGCIFVHYTSPLIAKWFNNQKFLPPIYIVFWGAEFFGIPQLKKHDLLPMTKNTLNKINPNQLRSLLSIGNFRKNRREKKAWRETTIEKIKLLRKAKYICHWIPDDIQYLKQNLHFDAIHVDFIYGTLSSILADQYELPFEEYGSNILIGNSASETNNHIDIFYTLKDKVEPIEKIYVPLSYSINSKEYVKTVIDYGYQCFGDKFHPLTEFLTRDEYNSILRSCGFIFMNHLRSQGGAVNRTVLYQGKKLFMNSQSNMFQFYSSKGLSVFTIDEITVKNTDLWKPLSIEEKEENRSALEKAFGSYAVSNRYKRINDLILNDIVDN